VEPAPKLWLTTGGTLTAWEPEQSGHPADMIWLRTPDGKRRARLVTGSVYGTREELLEYLQKVMQSVSERFDDLAERVERIDR